MDIKAREYVQNEWRIWKMSIRNILKVPGPLGWVF
jgi:hypothetical protein